MPASVLRPVGTHWRKGDGVRPVELLHDAPEYSVDIFNAIVGQYGQPVKSAAMSMFEVGNDMSGGMEYPPSSALQIIKNCAALNEVAEAKGNVAEPLWRAMIGVVKHTTEGDAQIHEWSKGDTRYSEEETQKKIDGWVNGPTTCQHFSDLSDKCKSCKHAGKITSPISLGMMEAETREVDMENTRAFFDIQSYSATRFINSKPPKVRWIFPTFFLYLAKLLL
jgi:hypothetical protein